MVASATVVFSMRRNKSLQIDVRIIPAVLGSTIDTGFEVAFDSPSANVATVPGRDDMHYHGVVNCSDDADSGQAHRLRTVATANCK